MSSEIVVQGEHFKDDADLWIAIEEIEETLEDMPSDTPEHAKLKEHYDLLLGAYKEATGAESPEQIAKQELAQPEEDEDGEEQEEPRPTHDLRIAAESGAQLLCPTCGQGVPFPELPPMDKTSERCPNCEGWGKVVTGSRVDGHIWHDCKTCGGEGVIPVTGTQVPEPARQSAQVPEAPGARWNPDENNWLPPDNAQPPWAGAVWDAFYGKWA